MSRRRRLRRTEDAEAERVAENSEDEGDYQQNQATSPSRPSSSGDGGFAALSEEQQDELEHRVVRYMLARNARKRPVKRADLTKHLFRDMANIRSKQRVFAGVLQRVQTTFRTVYGMQVVEIERAIRRDPQTQSQRATASASRSSGSGVSKAFILVTTLHNDVRIEDTKRLGEIGFLTVIASMILLTPGCRIDEESLYRSLERIGVMVKESGGHKQVNNGNVKEFLEKELPEQWYLEREKEGNATFYMLGARLRAEMSDDNLLDFVEAVYQLGRDGTTSLDETARHELKHRLVESRGPNDEEAAE